MPLTLAQANALIAAAHDHAAANGWKIAVAVVDEGGTLVALGRMDGAFPLSSQIAEAKAAGAALWHRDGDGLAASRASHEGFFDAVSRLVRLPLIPGPGSVVIRDGESSARRSRSERRERRRRPRLRRGRSAGHLSGLDAAVGEHALRRGRKPTSVADLDPCRTIRQLADGAIGQGAARLDEAAAPFSGRTRVVAV